MRIKRTMKRIGFLISAAVSLALFLVLRIAAGVLSRGLDSQTMAQRWSGEGSAAHVSCFFSVDYGTAENPGFDPRQIESFEHTLDGKLEEAAVRQESENPSARLWVDAYSASGTVSVSSGRATVLADAYGVGGDFFLFHPLKLKSGAYFSGNDLNQDSVLLDEGAAWQLFGSNDIAGQIVMIGGAPHIVSGVVENPSGRFAEAAGLDGICVYVSYQTLSEHGACSGISHYEICMPNPISGYAEGVLREAFGTDELRTEIVENSQRFSFLSNVKRIAQLGTRSMNGKAIVYPYWENMARGCEDIVSLLTFLWLLFLLYPIGAAGVFFVLWWRRKEWTVRDALRVGREKLERLAKKRIFIVRRNRGL